VDPWFLVGAAPDVARLIRAAREVNDTMPAHVLDRLTELVAPPGPIALLGVTYKAEVDDIRESPAVAVAELAVEHGFDVRLCDPHVRPDTAGLPAPLLPLEQAVRDARAVVLLVDHRAFKEQLDIDLVAALVSRRCVLDARNALDRAAWRKAGFEVSVLGSGAGVGSGSSVAETHA
jgi:UDP-N-acetyl-D-mannosaminuronic acid dehydrogenase